MFYSRQNSKSDIDKSCDAYFLYKLFSTDSQELERNNEILKNIWILSNKFKTTRLTDKEYRSDWISAIRRYRKSRLKEVRESLNTEIRKMLWSIWKQSQWSSIQDILSKICAKISNDLFYWICNINISKYCFWCEKEDYNLDCCLTENERWYFSEIIKIDNSDYYIKITFPANAKEIFDWIFTEEKNEISENIWNLINRHLNEIKILELHYNDQVTGLPNRNKLEDDLEKLWFVTLARISVWEHLSKWEFVYWNDYSNSILNEIANELKKRFKEPKYLIYLDRYEFYIVQKSDFDEYLDYFTNWVWEAMMVAWISIKYKMWIVPNDNEDQIKKSWYSIYECMSDPTAKLHVYSEVSKIQDRQIANHKNAKTAIDAINNKSYIPFYQWIIDNRTWKIEKYEVLSRLINEETWKLMVPWEFLPAVEEHWLLNNLTEIVFEKAMIEMIKPENAHCGFSFNLTEQDFMNWVFVKFVENTINRYWILPERITFEILEDTTTEWFQKWASMLMHFQRLWCKISIDDFWSKLWNIEKILEFRKTTWRYPDYIKLDWVYAKWIKKLDKESWTYETDMQERILAMAWLNSLVSFIRTLNETKDVNWIQPNIKLIAEYVDNEDAQDIIRWLWIEYSQWFLFSKPSDKLITSI